MSSNRPISEYEPVVPTPARRARQPHDDSGSEDGWGGAGTNLLAEEQRDAPENDWARPPSVAAEVSTPPTLTPASAPASAARANGNPLLRRGHAVSYAGLFLFTAFVYFRPYELVPALSFLRSGAFYIALLTLLAFVPTQLGLEGNLTVRPREIKLVLLLTLTALLSLPLAIDPAEAWESFVEYLKVVAMFIVMMNVVRTERRLKILLLLVLVASYIVSVAALNDYRTGNLLLRGTRVQGIIGGMLSNPNDLAMHLAMMIPVTFGLLLSTRGLLKKLIYVACALLMGAALVATFSRGGFLGMAAASLVMAWKLGRRNRVAVIGAMLIVMVLFVALAPGEYGGRLVSIVDKSQDLTGSSGARQELLIVSIMTIIKHPLLGVGMGNFHTVSIHEQVSHNAYTQVGAETGVLAMIIYVLFVVSPLKRLRRIERETLADPLWARDYYLAVCLQASVIGYMISSFFGSVAYLWYIYYLVAYAFCFSRIYEARRAATAGGERRSAGPGEQTTAAKRGRERMRRLHTFDDDVAIT